MSGTTPYLLQAITRYIVASGDFAHESIAVDIAYFPLGRQNADGGLFGRAGVTWKSTENNLAANSARDNTGRIPGNPDYTDCAQSIRGFRIAECWDGVRFLTGKNDPMIVTVAQALGVMALGPTFQSGAYWVEDHTQTTRRYNRGRKVTGFDLNTDRDTVWTEGTLQQALAFAVAGDTSREELYRQEAEKLFQATGAFWQASNTGTTGFGDNFRIWPAAAPAT